MAAQYYGNGTCEIFKKNNGHDASCGGFLTLEHTTEDVTAMFFDRCRTTFKWQGETDEDNHSSEHTNLNPKYPNGFLQILFFIFFPDGKIFFSL